MKYPIIETETGISIKREDFSKLPSTLRDEIIFDVVLGLKKDVESKKITTLIHYGWLSGLSLAIGFLFSKIGVILVP